MKKALFILPISLFLLGCGPNLCDCVRAEKNDSGDIIDVRLRTTCNELMAAKKKKLNELDPESKEEFLRKHNQSVLECMK